MSSLIQMSSSEPQMSCPGSPTTTRDRSKAPLVSPARPTRSQRSLKINEETLPERLSSRKKLLCDEEDVKENTSISMRKFNARKKLPIDDEEVTSTSSIQKKESSNDDSATERIFGMQRTPRKKCSAEVKLQ